MAWACRYCGEHVENSRLRGIHSSACARRGKSKHAHPVAGGHYYEHKYCQQCGEAIFVDIRVKFCSLSCANSGRNSSRYDIRGLWRKYSKLEIGRWRKEVYKVRGSASTCVYCHTLDTSGYCWVNVTGKPWDVYDYVSLCIKCHYKFIRRDISVEYLSSRRSSAPG